MATPNQTVPPLAGEPQPTGPAQPDARSAQVSVEQLDHRDEINAPSAQGVILNPSAPVYVTVNNNGTSPAAASQPASATQNKAVELYWQRLREFTKPLPKYNFPLTYQIVTATGAPSESKDSDPIEELLQHIALDGQTLLRGSAGSGKSTAVWQLIERLTRAEQPNIIPIYLRLGSLKPNDVATLSQTLSDGAEPELYIEPLLNCSPIPVFSADACQLNEWATLADDRHILVIADGLNEVYGEDAARVILERLTLYAKNRNSNVCILVTDRTMPRDGLAPYWKFVQLDQLTPEVVRQQFQAKGIEAIYHALGEYDQQLLKTPYFLEYALEHNTARLSSPTEAIAGFFKRLNLNDDALDRLSQAAYAAYADHHSYTFDAAPFTDIVGKDIFDMLVAEGVIMHKPSDQPAGAPDEDQPTGDEIHFDHRLKHDYLGARYLSHHDAEWNPSGLDALSFESNSFDALSMTLELLPNEASADQFVERVHSWNWAAAFVCIAKAMRYGNRRHSQEMQMAVLALVVEKLFDPVEQTRERARGILALFRSDIAAPYEQVADLKALCKVVQQQVAAESKFKDSESWFPRWRDLFVRFDSPVFSEQDLKNIVDTKSIIGWTAANVLKRFKLSDADVRQLCAYYDACNVWDEDNWLAGTIRWRVVHALGATDTQRVADMLFNVMSSDCYSWARIGAARSLVEIAALTSDTNLRQTVIARLIDAVNQAPESTRAAKTLREIGYSAFYRNAQSNWEQAVTPLIEVVCQRVNSSEQRGWLDLFDSFKKFSQQQALAVGSAPTIPAAAQPANA